MKVTKSIWFFVIIFAFFYGGCQCNSQAHQAEPANLELRFDNCASEKIIVERITPDDIIKTDSITLDKNGNGLLRLFPETEEFVLLRFPSNDFIPLVISKNTLFKVTADCHNIGQTFNIEGNTEAEALTVYFRRLFRDMAVSDSLGERLRMYKETSQFSAVQQEVMTQYELLYAQHKQFAFSLLDAAPDNLANLLILNQNIGNQRVFEMQTDTSLYFLIDRSLFGRFPENPHVVKFHEEVSTHKQELAIKQLAAQRLAPGNKAPDFSLPDISGRWLSLSDFQDKTVLLSFWASWENGTPNNLEMLKIMYDDYKDKGVEFIAVSMDNDETIWKNIVRQQKTKWLNVSDLKSSASPLIQLYNLPEKLPVYYLIGKDGVILAQYPSMMEIDEILYSF
ncbi:MAG: TlpA family protein disulfide reductase [Bacteroidales bacterium]|nr:TlpA family protein disulfide reductase [Bacteroidales bacterium]